MFPEHNNITIPTAMNIFQSIPNNLLCLSWFFPLRHQSLKIWHWFGLRVDGIHFLIVLSRKEESGIMCCGQRRGHHWLIISFVEICIYSDVLLAPSFWNTTPKLRVLVRDGFTTLTSLKRRRTSRRLHWSKVYRPKYLVKFLRRFSFSLFVFFYFIPCFCQETYIKLT